MDEQENTTSAEQPEEGKTYIDYEYGDLYIGCSCGHEYLFHKDIEGGIRIELYTTNSHSLKLGCPKCGTTISMFFKEAEDIFKLKAIKAEKQKLEMEEYLKQINAEEVEEITDEEVLYSTGVEDGGPSDIQGSELGEETQAR